MDPYSLYPTIRSKVVRDKNEGPKEPRPLGTVISLALLRTCRQMHAESSEELYGRNVFRFYMGNALFGQIYLPLVRHITFMMDSDHRIYTDDLDTVSYWWRRRVWPQIVDKSTTLLERFPSLETLTFPIKSNRHGLTWRPAFMASEQKTREQRVALAASWMKPRCPFETERLRCCLHLELVPAGGLSKDAYEGARFLPEDEWDCSEFAEAFERMKAL